MEEENYQLLLDKLKDYDSKIASLEKKVADVTAFNKTLLTTKSSDLPNSHEDQVKRHQELEKKLKEAL